jgi:hypothetical protein
MKVNVGEASAPWESFQSKEEMPSKSRLWLEAGWSEE